MLGTLNSWLTTLGRNLHTSLVVTPANGVLMV